MSNQPSGGAVVTGAVGFRSERGPILISLMLSTGLVAIDQTIIATAVPSVVANLGGFAQFPWLFSVYLLGQAVSVPIYGKLADLFGRKPIMLLGIGLFLLGSILCSVAWSMPALIAFRAVQGLGAGSVQPMGLTIAGDIYSLEERGRVQGYLASTWGVSAVIGPALGGLFSDYLSWRWIFIINIPLCLLAGGMIMRNFRERVTRRRHTLDYLGAALLAAGCTLLILALLEGGVAWPWTSPTGIAVPLAGLALLAVFVLVERRAAEPVLPLWVFRRRQLVAIFASSIALGAVLIGLTSYVPTFVQGVLGTGALIAGFTLATLTIGWTVLAARSSRLYLRAGFRTTALVGSVITLVGAALIAALGDRASVALVALGCLVVGAGFGLVAAPTLIAAQTSVGWSERGVVTATTLFCRTIGSALGVALFGAIANATLAGGNGEGGGLAIASRHVFLGVLGAAALMALAVAVMPRIHLTPPDDPLPSPRS